MKSVYFEEMQVEDRKSSKKCKTEDVMFEELGAKLCSLSEENNMLLILSTAEKIDSMECFSASAVVSQEMRKGDDF
jgi:hypothetical protein